MNSVTRLELKKLNNKKTYLIGIIFLVVITILMLTTSTTDVVDENGEFVSGISGWKILKEQGITSDGLVTVGYMKKEREKYQNSINKLYVEGIQTDDRDLGLKLEHPQSVLFMNLNFPYQEFNTLYTDMNLSDKEIEDFYKNRPSAIRRYLNQPRMSFNENEVDTIVKKVEDVKTPFYYAYNRGWHSIVYHVDTTFYIFLIYIAFILCEVLARNSENGIEQMALSTKESKDSLFKRKVNAAQIFSSIAYLCYIGLMIIYNAIIYSLHGANSSIQFFVDCAVFSINTWQAVLIEIIVGYFATLVITHLVLCLSALFKRGIVALFLCVGYIYLVNEYRNAISATIQKLMTFMPQRFLRGVLSTEKLTVIGPLVIPYAVIAILLSLVYMVALRLASKLVMKHYYIS